MLRKPKRHPTPSNWATLKPFGIGEQHASNYDEVFRAAWENRDNAAYAWRILNHGCCDGCALGTKGMRGRSTEPTQLSTAPGGVPVSAESAAELSAKWGFDVPHDDGLTAPEMIEAAARGELDFLCDAVLIESDHGELSASAFIAPIAAGNVEVHWPEGNVLIAPGRLSPEARIPDYNARVTVTRSPASRPAEPARP